MPSGFVDFFVCSILAISFVLVGARNSNFITHSDSVDVMHQHQPTSDLVQISSCHKFADVDHTKYEFS